MSTVKGSHKKWYVLVLLILIAAGVLAGLEVTNTTHLFHKAAVVRAPAKPLTSLPSGSSTTKNPSSGNSINQGTATDKNGRVPSNTPSNPDQWSTSASRLITVKLPIANSTFHSGDAVTGSTSIDPVQFRLVDDQVGVIAQGTINVVNGNFTATVNFKPYGSSGKLDVFSTDSTGKESNEVQIPVNF